MKVDAFSGFGRLYRPHWEAGEIVEAACWAYARRKFFELADHKKAPMAIAAVNRIDVLFAIERARPLVVELDAWLREIRRALSSRSATANSID